MSLLDAAERFASIDRSQVVLDVKRCLHGQDQYSECTACFEICPVQAIIAGNPPALNSDLCQSCLACLPVCPVGAYRADDDVADLLNCATHIEDQTVEIVCGLHPQPETGTGPDSVGIRMRGCLAGLGSGAYLTLSALGIQHITSRTDACRACKWQSLLPEIHQQSDRANRFLSILGRQQVLSCTDKVEAPVERALWSAKNPPLSRRDLFRMLARQGQVAMARAMENGVTTSERKPGRDRLRLLAAVSHFAATPAAVPGDATSLTDFDFAALTISETCTACGACGKACPTQALKFEKNEEAMTFTLSFSAQSCIDCGVCDHVCLPDAITFSHQPAFEEIFGTSEAVTVTSGALIRCERCKTLTAKRAGVTLCPLCEFRRTRPFGSLMPKKMGRKAQL